jgi:hypothetical protein
MKIDNHMKKYSLLITLSFLIFGSCTGVLDMAPDGKLTMEEIYKDPDKVESLVSSIYNGLPNKGFGYAFVTPAPTALSDDGWDSSGDVESGYVSYEIYVNKASASHHPLIEIERKDLGINNWKFWGNYWTQIRLCNQFIQNADNMAFKNDAAKKRLVAEVHVLRAFYYTEMIKWFGRVPLLDEVMPFDADFSLLERKPVYEIAGFIAKDCDFALQTNELPWRIISEGETLRVTRALALALKSTAMLFAASPLHNEGQEQGRWDMAYNYCKEAVTQLKANGYELFKTCTQPQVFGTYNGAAYHQLFCQQADNAAAPRDRETIYQHNQNLGWANLLWHLNYISSGFENTARVGTVPTQELIDAYETIDGQPVLDLAKPYMDEKHLSPNYNSKNTLYDPKNPYANRDPRMYATAYMNNDTIIWESEVYTIDAYVGGKCEIRTATGQNHTRTGYFHRKFITPGATASQGTTNAPHKFYRMGEMLLNLAEAANEAGHTDEALAALNEVRARVDMPPVATAAKDELRIRIHNERRVEFAFEENRYFDMRRWCKPDGDLGALCKYLTAMWINKNPDGTFTYERKNVWDTERGGWRNRDLLLPLPLAEVSRLEPLTGKKWQNPGW